MAYKIIYTKTDEAPALATHSLLPVVAAFAALGDVELELADISLASRILAAFGDVLPEDQRVPDALAALGALAKTPEANIIKLPNISASIPQLKAAVGELQAKGFALPDYPDDPQTEDDHETKRRYDGVKGSAVNPVLREGNSDRRAPKSVKEYAKKNPHSMGAWSSESKTSVVTMDDGDFRHSETSVTLDGADVVSIVHTDAGGQRSVLADGIALQDGEVIDGAVMSRAALREFLAAAIAEADATGVLFSLHLKATMMKVSDPIIFGHAVEVYFADTFAAYGDLIERAGGEPNNGLGNVIAALEALDGDAGRPALESIAATLQSKADVAMVNSDRGITNLHVPSDVIIDASMPAMIRTSGQMWNAAGEQQDTLATIPDSSYASIYTATIDDCKVNGAFDPTTMGSVSNVGLMAQKAEEYGSHDKTFEVPADGTVSVEGESGTTYLTHTVAEGDIWRMCQAKDAPIRDWVRLALTRARATGAPAVFWLDEDRAHDAELIRKVNDELSKHDTEGLTVEIMSPEDATKHALARVRAGEDTISVTGNVLRDYLTDLFPILELGTSAKMLSIVPLMAGGGLFETGAGGSAPKHVQQFEAENHLRWDSVGEFLALAASLEHLATTADHPRAQILADTLDAAVAKVLDNGKSPSRKVGELDNRGSHYYLATYWATELAARVDDRELADKFSTLSETLIKNESVIVEELNSVQGSPVEMGGYFFPDDDLVAAAMRPSSTLNEALAALG